MVFENEINIYDPNAIRNEFRTQSTQITAVQGKIGALISDSQIQELMDGRINMYDRLVSAEIDISGIQTQVSELRQTDAGFESQISTIRQTADSISAEVSQVKDDYAQKAQLILAINHVTQESEAVINASHISLAGKTISLTSDNIKIDSTYFKVDKDGRMTATAGTFSGSLNAATGTFKGALQAATGSFLGTVRVGGTGSNPWMLLDSDGALKGGKGSRQYGYMHYSAEHYDSDYKVTRYGLTIRSGVVVLGTPILATSTSEDGSGTAWKGASGTIPIVTNIRSLGGGAFEWSTGSMTFTNGLLTGAVL